MKCADKNNLLNRDSLTLQKIVNSDQYIKRIYNEVYLGLKKFGGIEDRDLGLELGSGGLNLSTQHFTKIIQTEGHYENANKMNVVFAEKLPFNSETFDFVIAKDALHHFKNPITALNEVDRVLKVGGVFVVSEPYWSIIGRLIFKFFHPENWNAKENILSNDLNQQENQALLLILSKIASKNYGRIPDTNFSLRLCGHTYSISYLLAGGVYKRNFLSSNFLSKVNKLETSFPKYSIKYLHLILLQLFRSYLSCNLKYL